MNAAGTSEILMYRPGGTASVRLSNVTTSKGFYLWNTDSARPGFYSMSGTTNTLPPVSKRPDRLPGSVTGSGWTVERPVIFGAWRRSAQRSTGQWRHYGRPEKQEASGEAGYALANRGLG